MFCFGLPFRIRGPTIWERIQIGLAQVWYKLQQIGMLGSPQGAKWRRCEFLGIN